MNVAIASPEASLYSETFIRLQMERLPCSLRIHGRPVATETLPGGRIGPSSVRGLFDVALHRGLRRQGADAPQAAELKRRLRRTRVAAVLANYGPTGAALLPVCEPLGLPLVVHFHGYDAYLHDVVQEYAAAYRRLAQGAAAIVAVSHAMAEKLQRLGFPQAKIHVTRCGVDVARFPPRHTWPHHPSFIGVGRFVDKKAPYLTLVAFTRALAHIPDARLTLIGDGPLLETCRNLAGALGVQHAVEFPGVLEPDRVAAQLRTSTAYVQHSIVPRVGPFSGDSEGTPVSVMEAMITGLPVIATRHAGIGEIVEHRKTGLLVGERDVEGMAAAMVEVARSPERARELADAARTFALENCTADRYISDLRRILDHVSRRTSA